MSNYHITPERALEIAKILQSHGFRVTVSEGDSIDFHDAVALAAYSDAVLDKVLGEQWIKVEDRLPDYDVLVNVYVDRSQRSLHNKVRTDYRNQRGCAKRNMWMQTRGDEKITHWMPLPSAPKEQS